MELDAALARFFSADGPGGPGAVRDVGPLSGHAGLTFGVTVQRAEGVDRYVLRLPPPGVRARNTADVVRQGRLGLALADSAVPVAPVRHCDDDPRWFGRPYLIVDRLDGRTIGPTDGSPPSFTVERTAALGDEALRALAALHALDPGPVEGFMGAPRTIEEEVTRWDPLIERSAEPALTAPATTAREALLAGAPSEPRVGVRHGDFQWGNLLADDAGLVAVLDWELSAIGLVLCDLGWLLLFSNPERWAAGTHVLARAPAGEELIAGYEAAAGLPAARVDWYEGVAAYAFALISGFNLMLHRTGKRPDPYWEVAADSIPGLLDAAAALARR